MIKFSLKKTNINDTKGGDGQDCTVELFQKLGQFTKGGP